MTPQEIARKLYQIDFLKVQGDDMYECEKVRYLLYEIEQMEPKQALRLLVMVLEVKDLMLDRSALIYGLAASKMFTDDVEQIGERPTASAPELAMSYDSAYPFLDMVQFNNLETNLNNYPTGHIQPGHDKTHALW